MMTLRREIRREECSVCRGQGRVCVSGSLECPTCLGVGWTQEPDGQESLCPQCRGFQQAEADHHAPCHECNASGYFIVLVELSEERLTKRFECKKCKGSGMTVTRLKGEDEEYCEVCGGAGDDVAYGIKHGIPLSDTRCPACRGRGVRPTIIEEEDECMVCFGRGSVKKAKVLVNETIISRTAPKKMGRVPGRGPSRPSASDQGR
jgi:DnaJ-class molecular chaperone